MLYAFRADTRTINLPYAFDVIEVGTAFLAVPRVIAFVAVMAVAVALWAIMQWTDTGKAIRAVAKEKLGAELSGIDVAHIYAVTFGLGTACVAVAACLLIPTYYVNPTAGDAFVLIAFTIVVLGGMGSIVGALIGGLFVGVVESLSSVFLGRIARPDRHFRDVHRRCCWCARAACSASGRESVSADRRCRGAARRSCRSSPHPMWC